MGNRIFELEHEINTLSMPFKLECIIQIDRYDYSLITKSSQWQTQRILTQKNMQITRKRLYTILKENMNDLIEFEMISSKDTW